MAEDGLKWYQIGFVKDIGIASSIAILLIGLGFGGGQCRKYQFSGEVAKAEADGRVGIAYAATEQQRLRTIEEMTRAYSDQLSPEELTNLLHNNGLDRQYCLNENGF